MKVRILSLVLCILIIAVSIVSCTPGQQGDEAPPPSSGDNSVAGNVTDKEESDRNEVMKPLTNDFLSRTATEYKNINGKTVSLYNFFIDSNEAGNNPNFPQAVLIYQCMRYKDAHPTENVSITVTSFHLSVYLAACLDPESPEYGNMKNLFDEDYSEDGYYRLSYLLVEAARKGIEVTVIGQIDASAVRMNDGTIRPDGDFDAYFTSHLKDSAYIEGKTVADFMTFRKAYWLSYGDKSAADMMHNKTLTVSNFIDNDGNEHGCAFWTGSINLDGIHESGANGNSGVQSAVVVVEHDELRRVAYNYTRLLANYCKQEEAVVFRKLVNQMNTEQIALINAGKASEIPADEQIVYLGTENDSVFELYFSSFGGAQNSWDTVNNPYCKYLSKLSPSVSDTGYIELIWNNVKYKQTFALTDMIIKYIANAFVANGRTDNTLSLHLPGMIVEDFADLTEGENIGTLSLNEYNIGYHIKDILLSYEENGERHYVTVYNSLNIHEGSMAYQTNTVLVVNETRATGNNNYVNYGIMTTPGIDFESKRIK